MAWYWRERERERERERVNTTNDTIACKLTHTHLLPLVVSTEHLLDENRQVVQSLSPLVLHLKHCAGVPDENLGTPTREIQVVAPARL